uniref:IlGF domain-containing protein n=1 Tax=Panagrellus redivivus TaxID=6233 RepID=A0A7E4UZA4_PANRE
MKIAVLLSFILLCTVFLAANTVATGINDSRSSKLCGRKLRRALLNALRNCDQVTSNPGIQKRTVENFPTSCCTIGCTHHEIQQNSCV